LDELLAFYDYPAEHWIPFADNCLNPNLQRVQRRTHRNDVWDRCRTGGGLMVWPPHLPGGGAMSSEDIQGDEWGAYVTLARTAETNMGSPTGRESYGDGVPVVVAGVTAC
jgi:hypothetical protein